MIKSIVNYIAANMKRKSSKPTRFCLVGDEIEKKHRLEQIIDKIGQRQAFKDASTCGRNDIDIKETTRSQVVREHDVGCHRAISSGQIGVCHICGKVFKNKYNFKRHLQKHGICTEERIICLYCDRSYTRQELLDHHVDLAHVKSKSAFKCLPCNVNFNTKQQLEKHHAIVHEKIKRFLCDVCGKAFSDSTNMNVHKKTHNKKLKDCREIPIVRSAGSHGAISPRARWGSQDLRVSLEAFGTPSRDLPESTRAQFETNKTFQRSPEYIFLDD